MVVDIILFLVLIVIVIFVPRRKSKTVVVERITESQRRVSGVWSCQNARAAVFLEITMIGQIVEGCCVRNNTVMTIINGRYLPPDLSFSLTREDGAELSFAGRVSADGGDLQGRFSDYYHSEQLTFKRLPLQSRALSPAAELDAAGSLSTLDYREVDYSLPESSLAPLLVYQALCTVLQASVRMIPEYDLETIATLTDAMQVREPLLLEPKPESKPMPALSHSPGAASETIVVTTMDTTPAPVPIGITSTTAQSTSKRCPKCNVEWTEAFSFCLHCGYTQ